MNIRFYNAKILVPAENHKFQITEGELWVKGKEICYIGDGKTGVDAVCKNGEVLANIQLNICTSCFLKH